MPQIPNELLIQRLAQSLTPVRPVPRLRWITLAVVSLWVGLPHYINASPNPRGALALVQKLTACLEFSVDEEPLRARAAAFEERISKLVSSDSELSEYVKQLKKREFSQ